MIFDVLTLFPEMIENHCKYSILKRAVEKQIL
ncbi:MAG: tRNA (guanosine(37)-N1)-methyltransferase TrmD, partial [Candidatus Gastranaerophilaceae bacterium]